VDTGTEDSCALQATKFSKLVSERGPKMLTEEFLRSAQQLRLSTEEGAMGEAKEEKIRDQGKNVSRSFILFDNIYTRKTR
jgi:hypothetical protein